MSARVDRMLRVAYVWNRALQAEQLLAEPRDVVVGSGAGALFPLPQDIAPDEDIELIEPDDDGGYRLRLGPEIGGCLWLEGERQDVSELRQVASTVPIGRRDYGVVTLGTAAVFFQYVSAPEKAPRSFLWVDGAVAASLALSLFLHTALLSLMFLAARDLQQPSTLELPTDLIARFMVTPPPPSIVAATTLSGDDPGGLDDYEARDEPMDGPESPTEAPASPRPTPAPPAPIDDGGSPPAGSVLEAIGQVGLDPSSYPSLDDLIDGVSGVRGGHGRSGIGTGLAGVVGGTGVGGPAAGPGGAGSGPTGGQIGGGGTGEGVAVGQGRGVRELPVRAGRPLPQPGPGYLSPEAIQRVVNRRKNALRFCYENVLQRRPDLAGDVRVQFRIELSGDVSRSQVVRSTLNDGRVENCIAREIGRWQFPQPDGGAVVVYYPFFFGMR